MFPILYEQITAGTVPQHNGLGVLSDCVLCEVEQERNSIYELVMEYPKSGIHAKDIAIRRVLKAKPNFTDKPQLFRIDRISKELNGNFTVYAKHISYDLSGYVIARGSASNAIQACNLLEDAADGYTFDTDKVVSADFNITEPSSVKSWFAGKQGSFLDVFGTAEFKYDNFNVHFLLHAGQDRGVTIRYGKNLLELSQEMDCSNLCTAVMCYYKEEDGTIIDGDVISTGLTLDVPKVMVIDCSSDFEETPTVQELNQKAQNYISNNNLTLPSNNITLDFVQSGELTNRVDLCDTVTIYYEALGISRANVKCIRTKWDCLREKYIETEFGDVKTDVANTIINQQNSIKQTQAELNEKVTASDMETAINDATSLITGNSGGYIVLHDANNDGKPDELLVMDTPSISTSTKVWRWNSAGLGYSSTGYSGTYGTAITQNGQIVADFIKTGTLNANLIKAGVISDVLGKSTIDLATGIAKLYELNAIKGFNLLTEGDEDVKATFTATQFGADFILSPLDAYDYPFAKIETLSRQNESYSNFKLSNDGETYTTILQSDSTGGNVEVYNASGILVADMFARVSGVGGTVRTKNNDGTTAVSMYTTDSGGNIKVGNSTGNDRVFIWVGGNDDGVINVFDTNGNPTVTFEGATGKIHCQRIQPYDPDYSVDNASGTMHLDASGWEVRRMGNVVYMAIPFKGTGVNVPAGSTAFTGTLADGDLPAIPCNMVAYYSGDVFILNIKANGEMTLRNCGGARTFSSNQGITICGSFIVD